MNLKYVQTALVKKKKSCCINIYESNCKLIIKATCDLVCKRKKDPIDSYITIMGKKKNVKKKN